MRRNCSLITSLEKSPNCHSLSAASFPITICSWHTVHSLPSSTSRKLGTRGERCHPSKSRHATEGEPAPPREDRAATGRGALVCGPGGKYSGLQCLLSRLNGSVFRHVKVTPLRGKNNGF
jgi:hypothetical protein